MLSFSLQNVTYPNTELFFPITQLSMRGVWHKCDMWCRLCFQFFFFTKYFPFCVASQVLALIPTNSDLVFVGDSRIRQIYKGVRNFFYDGSAPPPYSKARIQHGTLALTAHNVTVTFIWAPSWGNIKKVFLHVCIRVLPYVAITVYGIYSVYLNFQTFQCKQILLAFYRLFHPLDICRLTLLWPVRVSI